MSIKLSISDVRQALQYGTGTKSPAGDGAPSTALLGKWFHEGLQYLIGHGEDASPIQLLSELEPDLDHWKAKLAESVYARVVGPRLTRSQAGLQACGPQVLGFWQAMRAACSWLAELSWELRPVRRSQQIRISVPWRSLADLIQTEEPVSCLLKEPGWSDAVQLVGIADAVVRLKNSGVWCAVEFKLGQTSPAVDLGQACLYHIVLTHALLTEETDGSTGSLALVRFTPERQEQVFSANEIASAREKLLALIGKMAGVAGVGADSVGTENEVHKVASPAIFSTVPTAEHQELGKGLVKTLGEYGVQVKIDDPIIAGPTFLRFPLNLGPGTKVSSVGKFSQELQVRLQLKAEPFINVDDGRLVIDVQRPDRKQVDFDAVRNQLQDSPPSIGGSQVPVGIDLSGKLHLADLSRPEHAHLLVVGTTGSGKSEWLRFAAAGLIATNSPETLRLLIIDPKRNAFHALRNSNYMWKPIVYPDEHDPVAVLEELADEMDRRYRLFEGADSFSQVVSRTGIPLPRIVCICDEFRDLISRDRKQSKQIECQIFRLGAKARAAGIHLILATQEASRETIKGALDSNMSARIGLKMGKAIESRLLFGQSGAERLLGHGDLLFKDIGEPRRLQAPLLSEQNREELFGQH